MTPVERRTMKVLVRNLRLFVRHGRQWWYWTPEWQAEEREATADLAAGRYKTYTNADAFLADLDSDV